MSFRKVAVVLAVAFALTNCAHAIVSRERAAPLAKTVQKRMEGTEFSIPNGVSIMKDLQKAVIKEGECNPNVCFLLHDSGAISEDDYRAQIDFVLLVSAIIGVDIEAEFAAARYGVRTFRISKLQKNVNRFLRRMDRARFEGAPTVNIDQGLRFCVGELNKRPGDANKIVLFADGRSTYNGPNPVPRAQSFRPPGDICAVAVAFPNPAILNAITGNPANVLPIDGYFEMLDILDALVEQICGFPLP